jgi:GNAT superfamily N-acetyltransferase
LRSIEIRRLHPADWAAFRAVRLEALRDAPEAFGSTADASERLSEVDWRQRLAERVVFVAIGDDRAVGLVSGIASDRRGVAELISMWVRPDWRRQGVGSRLVETVIEWAGEHGFKSLRLWVADGNDGAERLYSRHGFKRTGERQPMAKGRTPRWELGMARRLGSSPRGELGGAGEPG